MPTWLTGRRIAALLAVVVITPIAVYGARVVGGLSKLTGSNPGAVLGCLIKVKCDSVLASSTDRINIALYGYPGGDSGDAYLSDSIMVVSIQPRGNGQPPQVAEISVPRDWYVPIDTGDTVYHGRINEAYEDGLGRGPAPSAKYKGDPQGGGKLADATLSSLLGLHIDHFIGVDFHAFDAAVDAVGGIDVDVPDSFTDNQYPHGDCDQGDCAVMTVHFNKGLQHMDGAQALIFARSRHAYDNPSEASNFARNRRQQLILNALKQKVLSIGGIGQLPDLLNALGDNVRTDLGIADVNALYRLIKGVDTKSIIHVSIDDTNFLYECGYPRNCPAAYEYAHDNSYHAIARYLHNVFVDPATLAEKTPVTIEDGTGAGAGASTRWGSLFGAIGFTTSDGGWVHHSATTQVIDNSGGRGSKTAHWLANYFGVTVQTPAAPSAATGAASAATPASAVGVTVVLGEDSEHAWNGTGQGYPGNTADNAPSALAPAAAQQPATSSSAAATASPTRRPTPPPSAPTPTPQPTLCLPPVCKPVH